MTCSTSAVAVCCSNASRVSVRRRAFSIAITACAAKCCNRAICFSVNGRTSRRFAVMSGVAYRDLIRAFVRFYAEQLLNPRWGESVNLRRDDTLSFSMVSRGLDKATAQTVWQPFLNWHLRKFFRHSPRCDRAELLALGECEAAVSRAAQRRSGRM